MGEFHASFTLVCFSDDFEHPRSARCLDRDAVLDFFGLLGTVTIAQDDPQMNSLGIAGLHQKTMLSFLHSMQLSLENVGIPSQLAAQAVSQLQAWIIGRRQRNAVPVES